MASELTQDEIIQGRERLAKWMGWWIADEDGYELSSTIRPTLFPKYARELNEGRYPNIQYRGAWKEWLPDQNLNQIHEIEKNLTDDEWKKYIKILWSGSFDKFSASKDALYLMIKETVSATALQRFEALINTIGE